ncbi:Notch-regulated ankyrin repeat-containing protein [Penaeus vannamei]|uniref:Notch-regulated ankyrin repeat-containing protein n=1 Tax=Penaeus vannamei TaxID=6689 RepID=A0A423SZI9_PENVA|nr:Notch-regulated ankyrin repeat-containing protein [Penaeus vannamei]
MVAGHLRVARGFSPQPPPRALDPALLLRSHVPRLRTPGTTAEPPLPPRPSSPRVSGRCPDEAARTPALAMKVERASSPTAAPPAPGTSARLADFGFQFTPAPPGYGDVEQFGCQAEFVRAVLDGNPRELKRILTRYSQLVQINGFTADGQTALTQSCMDGNLEVIKVLVAHGASLHLTNRDGFSPSPGRAAWASLTSWSTSSTPPPADGWLRPLGGAEEAPESGPAPPSSSSFLPSSSVRAPPHSLSLCVPSGATYSAPETPLGRRATFVLPPPCGPTLFRSAGCVTVGKKRRGRGGACLNDGSLVAITGLRGKKGSGCG